MLPFPKTPANLPDFERPSLERDVDGSWLYEGTGITAVGARDITLAEVADPLVIAQAGREPEAVLLPLAAIIEDQRLNWVLQVGTKLDGDAEPLFKVRWAEWQEHASEPVSAWLPEFDATGLDRLLAAAERELRFAKQAFDAAGLVRNRLVLLATRLGRSRREVGEILGLSTARVQQLNEDPSTDLAREVEDFLAAAARVAVLVGEETRRREEIPAALMLGSDLADEVVDSMRVLELLEEVDDGLRLSASGRALIDPERGDRRPRKKQKTSADRERVGDAAK